MGNAADEGFKYRGRGLIQLTGKDNYRTYGRLIGIDLVSNPDRANELDTALKVAATYFAQKQRGGVDLTDISAVGHAVGYAGGKKETVRRAKLAEGFLVAGNTASSHRGYEFGGIAQGPESGFDTVLHGTEAVIPMNTNKSITVDMQGMNESIKNQFEIMTAQSGKLDDLISIMRKRNNISEKILRAYQS
jgi:hypothetical protein